VESGQKRKVRKKELYIKIRKVNIINFINTIIFHQWSIISLKPKKRMYDKKSRKITEKEKN